jgi:hypothetical protein
MRGENVHETRHISLFALAPIPLLVFLGSQLSSKVPVDASSVTETRKIGSGRIREPRLNTALKKSMKGRDRRCCAAFVAKWQNPLESAAQ